MNTNFGQMYNRRVPWYQDPCPAKQTNFQKSNTASYINKSYPMMHGRQGRSFQTNKFINGFRSFVSGLFFPAFNSTFYPEQYKRYNQSCKNNFRKETNVNMKQINIEPCLKAAACMSSFVNSRPQGSGIMEMDKDTKVIAIFTSEDFPELPPPKKPSWQPKAKEKCSYFEISTKSTKTKSDENIRKDSECDSEDSFIIFGNCSPKCSSTNNVNNSPVKCIPFRERQRQISECSDDSFVICFTEDAGEGLIEFSDCTTDCDSDEENNNENNDDDFLKKTENYHIYSDETSQPDSGFDEQKHKKVHFNLKPEVHVMHTWKFAYQAARKGHWENFALDRLRFQHRIKNISEILNPILNNKHREMIFKSRFCDKNNIN